MDEPCSPTVIDDEAANLHTSSSCVVLPGICNYSSDSDNGDEDADNEQVSPRNSPISNAVKEEDTVLTTATPDVQNGEFDFHLPVYFCRFQ